MFFPLLLLALLLGLPALWLVSVLILASWSHFRRFFLGNLLLMLAYLFVLSGTSWVDYGHDEYGLRRIFLPVAALLGHLLLGFVFALGYYLYRRPSRA